MEGGEFAGSGGGGEGGGEVGKVCEDVAAGGVAGEGDVVGALGAEDGGEGLGGAVRIAEGGVRVQLARALLGGGVEGRELAQGLVVRARGLRGAGDGEQTREGDEAGRVDGAGGVNGGGVCGAQFAGGGAEGVHARGEVGVPGGGGHGFSVRERLSGQRVEAVAGAVEEGAEVAADGGEPLLHRPPRLVVDGHERGDGGGGLAEFEGGERVAQVGEGHEGDAGRSFGGGLKGHGRDLPACHLDGMASRSADMNWSTVGAALLRAR